MKKPSTNKAMSERTVAAFLRLIEKDIVAGRNIGDLPPPRLLAQMRRVMREVLVDLDEKLKLPTRRKRRGRNDP